MCKESLAVCVYVCELQWVSTTQIDILNALKQLVDLKVFISHRIGLAELRGVAERWNERNQRKQAIVHS